MITPPSALSASTGQCINNYIYIIISLSIHSWSLVMSDKLTTILSFSSLQDLPQLLIWCRNRRDLHFTRFRTRHQCMYEMFCIIFTIIYEYVSMHHVVKKKVNSKKHKKIQRITNSLHPLQLQFIESYYRSVKQAIYC